MSFDVNWDIDKYKEDHESDEHWQLRRLFMTKWKNNYPEERLVCLARVFANIEFMGCRYPIEVMQEVSSLSKEVAQEYRNSKRGKLQRTFVSASDAAEDRAKGIKRQGGVIVDAPQAKSSKIQFVPQGQVVEPERDNVVDNDKIDISDDDEAENKNGESGQVEKKRSEVVDANEYLKDMERVKCLDVRLFKEGMFHSIFGRMVLLIRPWAGKLWNIQTSCQVCGVNLQNSYTNNLYSLTLNGKLLAEATGPTKQEARSIVEMMAWNRLKEEVISVVVKEQWIAQGDARISVSDVTGKRDDFGTPVENSVATKMMKLMGWKGGGLGAESQGIAEPIKPNLQMVNRAGLGSLGSDIRQLRKAGQDLMQRYLASDTLDLDLVFSSDFTKDERATLHQIAQRAGLASKSYGDKDRFLVVKKKLDPFSLARAVIDKGGCTPKYQVFIPAGLQRTSRR
ncbi:uncharacterized protein LOC106141341 [Amyelois transitella]|uniref:uncharacterized protein LOC106141341 n=1 Tax=Amyelois transitella TaxID=680683 RepID=UPI0029903E94|nr:uncharacterized protein LOC106141341 [Amyelois transitella]